MRRRLIILSLLLATGLSARAFEDDFDQAAAAYDAGRYAEAASLYENILSNGVTDIEVHYNLANALFKEGDLANAVWHYRTAWYNAPRDPDIRANLSFALNAANAIEPAPTFIERLFSTCSAMEWIWIGLLGYLLFMLCLLFGILLRSARTAWLRLGLLPLAALLAAAGGWWYWNGFRSEPEAVIRKAGVTALYGPVEGATAYYTPPEGALVRQYDSNAKGWVEIEYDGKRGWVKDGNILTLSP